MVKKAQGGPFATLISMSQYPPPTKKIQAHNTGKRRICLHVKGVVVCRPVGFWSQGRGAGFLIGGFSLLTSYQGPKTWSYNIELSLILLLYNLTPDPLKTTPNYSLAQPYSYKSTSRRASTIAWSVCRALQLIIHVFCSTYCCLCMSLFGR